MGIQGIALLDSWLVDDDFSAAAFVTKLDNFTITLAYIAGQNVPDSSGNEGESYYSTTKENVDDYAFAITYAKKGLPIKATLTGVFMNANMVPWAIYPEVMQSPISPGTGLPGNIHGRCDHGGPAECFHRRHQLLLVGPPARQQCCQHRMVGQQAGRREGQPDV